MKKELLKKLFVCLAIISNIINVHAQDPNFHIYLCFGQSNMEGQGTIETQDKTVDSRFQIMQAVSCTGQPAGTWRTATPPLARCNTKLGPTDYFGREMVKNLPSNVKVGVVLVAVAGCKIELFDKTNYASYAAGEQQWMKDIIAQYGGNPYGKLVELAKLAQKDGIIKGILLHQGESNSGDDKWPSKVKGVYDNLIKDLGLSSSNVPLLAGQLVDATQGGLCAGHNNIINNLPSTIPTSHVISSAGCTDVADNLHFSSAGYRLLGARYATKMLSLLPPVVKNIVPLVSITEPLNQNYTAPASITVSATATDADGSIASVGFYNGNKLLFSDNNFPYSYNWVNVDAGIYNLTAIAIDNTGAKDTSSILKVIVAKANAKPVVELYTSVNDFNLSAPAYISLTANATDADGSISSVGFYNGNTLLSTDYTEPYSYDWSNVQKGIYNITARAIDNNGASDTSAVLDFNVSVVNALNDFETLINNTNVFPNPFNEMVNVPENIEYQIIDINGLIVEKGLTRINSQIGQNLITGSYTLTLQKGKIKKYIQIIKN